MDECELWELRSSIEGKQKKKIVENEARVRSCSFGTQNVSESMRRKIKETITNEMCNE